MQVGLIGTGTMGNLAAEWLMKSGLRLPVYDTSQEALQRAADSGAVARLSPGDVAAEADLPILIGHVQGNPNGGFSGGYKMAVTGTASWPSIRGHYNPDTMHRHDFLPASTNSQMRRQFDSIGRAVGVHLYLDG